ncbi:hypothetical protein NLI96_g3370 [Meripilus lineatus]|uniref:Uncharacterized protein n=1 Tax=Meripilus lineatus TaxID=2056292 RepID=A0AAD5V8A7_9APHY|nr:hypothetical protein NLI96_g3370 [Physisporinus lineatus]
MAEPTLPSFLDPLLDYLSDILPTPIYLIVDTLLVNWVALLSSLYTLTLTLISSSPTNWNSQTLIPPLITLLAAYFALLTFYRTATWFIRTTFAFIKWGIILSFLGMAVGYLVANGGTQGLGLSTLVGSGGILPSVGGFLLGLLSGGGQGGGDATGGRRQRPNSWDTWDQHRQWQYEAYGQGGNQGGAGVQEVIQNILGGAGRIVQQGGWWETAKGMAEDFSRTAQANVAKEEEKQRERKARNRSRRSKGSQSRSQ